ncbi:serine/threonine-protein kinase [Zavarzinella formosa]|uniref:serine/threonine-protein kinase n=1 Tax=Zavarzinella formosa TaxID=360055 RepID=UPI00031310DB|nr:serine/threonine-protein kinase [Zavarzinella formosa]
MTPDEQLALLLDNWQQTTETGGEISPGELCRDHPELLAELTRQINILRNFQSMMPPPGPAAEVSVKSAAEVLPPGTEIDRYRLLGKLGDGGMGVVYRATSHQFRGEVAVKMMHPAVAGDVIARVRFLQEAKSLTGFRHPNIVTVLSVGQFKSSPYIVMEMLRGESLDARIKSGGKLPSAEVRRIGLALASGLAAAHARELIHRDIKPGNIWIEAETGRVVILDFGLVRLKTSGEKLTGSAEVLGTPAFMAPEQAVGGVVNHRCDLFSLGAVLYEAATGVRPFRGANTMVLLKDVVKYSPPTPTKLDGNLAAIIMALLAKNPDDRPPTAANLIELLEGREQLPAIAPAKPSAKKTGRRLVFFGGIALAAALVLSLVLWMIFR